MRAIIRFIARLLGATVVTTVVLISFTMTAAAAAPERAAPERLQPAADVHTTPWTVVAWLASGVLVVVAAGVTLTVVGRLRAGRSGTSR